ncbi:MAG: hypothetical protein KDG89_09495, partial [Geminicoccaceae bacterium]|nr:hypothetical protein [Geminicoccaceae bacterium]
MAERIAGIEDGSGGFVVTTADDVVDAGDGVLSLREAVEAANARAGADTITFADGLKGGEVVLTGGALGVTDDLTVDGDAANGGAGGVLLMDASRGEDTGEGSLSGFSTFEADEVLLRVEDLTIDGTGRVTSIGSAIDGYGAVEVVRSAVQNFKGSYIGGVFSSGALLVEDSRITGIDASEYAVGAESSNGMATVRNSLVDGITGYNAVGIGGEGASIENSTIAHVGGEGRSFGVATGDLSMTNSTVADVTAVYGRDGVAGVLATGGTITNSTITGSAVTRAVPGPDDAFGEASGVLVGDGDALVLQNSVVVGNEIDVSGTLASNGG